ncbi:unnamed protein product [Plutella xylostella]|uniref:(diamondback moth) hypothetical protein n=1 Tax=Plutella xylostella TaxID=51655 RepID=A0A8S4F363_PLUXY|nr:unnamed protein product [Plutella xylostella]
MESNKVIINEFLTFVQNKIDKLDELSVVQICATNFNDSEVEHGKSVLYENISDSGRCILRKGDDKTKKNLKDVIKLFKDTHPDRQPIFVAQDLNKLPPVTFDYIDVTRLLKDLVTMKTELQNLRNDCVSKSEIKGFEDKVCGDLRNLESSIKKLDTQKYPATTPSVQRRSPRRRTNNENMNVTPSSNKIPNESNDFQNTRPRHTEPVRVPTYRDIAVRPAVPTRPPAAVPLQANSTRPVRADKHDDSFTLVERKKRKRNTNMSGTAQKPNTELLGLSSNTYTFISKAHGTRRWLDHCLTTTAAWSTVVSARVLYDVGWSDHLPLAIDYKQGLPASVEGLQDPGEIADMFAGRFKVAPRAASAEGAGGAPAGARLAEERLQFTARDVARALAGMKRGKSPGLDRLSVEHLLYAGENICTKLCNLYNMCIRYSYLPSALMKTVVVPVAKNKTGDLGSAGNYRPISLGTILGKVLERLLQPELVGKLDISDAQFGFRPGLLTDSAILSLKHTVKYYTDRSTSVYACFLDLSKAFDLVNYNILWNKLSSSDVPNDVISLLRYWYGNQTNCVRWGDATSNEYRLDCGVRQGGLTSPDLFNLYIDDLIRGLRSTNVGCHIGGVCVNNLSYADDMVLLSPSIRGLQKLLSVCEHYANAHGLKYNVSKTEMLVFRAGRGPERVPEVVLDGAPVRVVQQFRYLGHILTSDLRDDTDIERERRALSIRCNMLARRFHRCSEQVKITLFRAYCQNIYTGRAMSTMRVQYNDAYRTLMRRPRYCSASGMFSEAGVPDFFAVLRSRIATFWSGLRSTGNAILKVPVGEQICYAAVANCYEIATTA